jgi:hypothetical protein
MDPQNPPDWPQPIPEISPDAAPVSRERPGVRYSWKVKDCLMCSWHQLSEPYSIDEMWGFLRQGRFSEAYRMK